MDTSTYKPKNKSKALLYAEEEEKKRSKLSGKALADFDKQKAKAKEERKKRQEQEAHNFVQTNKNKAVSSSPTKPDVNIKDLTFGKHSPENISLTPKVKSDYAPTKANLKKSGKERNIDFGNRRSEFESGVRSVAPVSGAGGHRFNLYENPTRLRELQEKKKNDDLNTAASYARKFLQADDSVSNDDLIKRYNGLTAVDVTRLLQSEEQRNKALKKDFIGNGLGSLLSTSWEEAGKKQQKSQEARKAISESDARLQQYRIWLNENDLRQKADEVKAKYSGLQNEPDYWERSSKAEKKLPYFRSEANDIYEYYVSRFSPETNKYDKYKNINLETDNAGKFLTHATPDEMRNYIYLYNKQGEKAAKEYYDMLEPDLRKRSANAEMEKAEKRGKEHPYISTAETIASYVPVSAVGGAAVAKSALTGKVDPYDPLYVAGAAREAEREATTNLIKNDALRLTYSAVTSAADNAVAALTVGKAVSAFGGAGMSAAAKAAWTGRITGGIMSSGVAASSVLEAKKEGFSDTSALAVGIARGSIEYLSEKFSIERIMKEPTTVLKALRKAVVSEGSEEVVSNWANRLVDNIINMGLTREYNELVESGMSEKEAFLTVAEKAAYEDLESFMGGAIAGGFMTAGGLGVQTAKAGGVKNMNQVLEYQSELAELPDDVRERVIRENEKSYNRARAVELLSKDKPEVSDIAGALNFLDVPEPVQTAHAIENFKNTNETSELLSNDGAKEVVEALAANGYFKKIDNGQLTIDNERAADNTESNYNVNVKSNDNVNVNVTERAADGQNGAQNADSYAPPIRVNTDNRADSDRVKIITDSIGDEGKRAYHNRIEAEYEAGYSGSQSVFLNDFNAFYAKGFTGGKIEDVNSRFADRLSLRTRKAAFEAGQRDRAAAIDAKYKAANEAVIRDGGLIMNHNTEGRADAQVFDELGRKFGVTIEIADSVLNDKGKEVNGLYSQGEIKISKKAAESFNDPSAAERFVIKHELLHRVETLAPKHYTKLRELIYNYAQKQNDSSLSLAEQAVLKKNIDMDTAIDEVAADYIGNESFALDVAMHDLTLADRIKGFAKDILDLLGIKKYSEAERIARMWEKACAEAKKTVDKSKNRVGNDVEVKGNAKYSDSDITTEEIKAVQSIGRKSINDFTSEDIKKTESFARKYFKEMGVKSPFFRAWFGDWRANDNTPIKTVQIDTEANSIPKGIFKNSDTGWNINVSAVGIRDTVSHSGKEKLSVLAMNNIDSIIKNAVLLDSEVSEVRGQKGQNTLFMHKLYALNNIGDKTYISKLSVEEYGNGNDTGKRFYNLREIKISPALGRLGTDNGTASTMRISGDSYTVSQLFNLVKASDKNFSPREASKVVNEDGTPKVMYHGSPNDFSVFDLKKARYSGTFGKGFYFTDSNSHASTYGNLYKVYLDVKNPVTGGIPVDEKQLKKFITAIADNEDYSIENYGTYDTDTILNQINKTDLFTVLRDINSTAIGDFVEAVKLYNKVNGTDYDGIISNTETVVFSSNQIKSATDNIGTFDRGNNDTRYSDGDLNEVIDVSAESKTTNTESDIVKTAQNDLDTLIKAYGAFDRGEEPRGRDIEIPKKTADDKYTSRYARTAAEANAIGDESAAGIMAAVAEGAYSYSRVSDTQAWKKAEFDIQKSGIEAARERWDGLVKSGKFADKYDIALAEYLLQMAGKNNDTDEVVRLTCEIAAMGTKAGQTVQALRLLKKMDGVSQLQYVERVVDNLQKDLDKRFKNKAPQIEIDEELKKKLAGAKNRDKIDAVTDEILTNIADQMPSTWLDKWNAWRYLAMLGNPRTHIRNIVGNAIFVPAVKIKNSVAYVIESAADKVLKIGGKKGIEKSKSVTTVFASKEYKSFAELDFEAVKDVLTGGGKLNAKSMIEERRSIFKFTPLEKFRVFNDNMLEAEDRLFLKAHYKSALISYLQANKIDVNTLTESNAQGFKTLERARSYAIQEAQKATYRDANSFSNALNVLARSSKPAQYALDALLPFRKTPANILRRGIEYSPAGLISTLTRGVYKVATGNMTATEFIDNLSSGLTGTAIMAVGAMLSSLGFLTGKPRDDEEEFKESIGMQSYALQFHKDGKTHSYTIDWAIPACMPLFVGAEINRLIENDEQMNLSTFFDSLGTVADPIFELSMLDGINNTLSSVSNMGENEKEIPVILREMVTSYFGQGVPTLLGQITRTFADDTRRRTYMDKNSKIPTALQYAAQRQMNKIPGLVKKQEPYVNEWGKADVTENIFERAFENFFSPGYYSVSDENKVNSELIRLSKESTEETPIDVFPKSMPRYFNVDKKRKDLTAKEFTKFQETAGQESFELLQAGFDTDTYKSMTLDERVDFIKTVYDVAKIKGKQAVSDYEPSSDWVKWAIEKGDDAIVNAALFKAKAGEDYFIKIDNMNGFIKSYDAGLDVDGYTQFFLETKGINAKDENGKTVSGLKQKRLIEKLQSMDLTNEERAYYYSTYYENPKNNPWKAYLKN